MPLPTSYNRPLHSTLYTRIDGAVSHVGEVGDGLGAVHSTPRGRLRERSHTPSTYLGTILANEMHQQVHQHGGLTATRIDGAVSDVGEVGDGLGGVRHGLVRGGRD